MSKKRLGESPKEDLRETVSLWTKRLNKLGQLAAGPTKWMGEDLKNPRIVNKLFEEESNLSREVLRALPSELGKVLVVGFGTAADLKELLARSAGKCYGVDCTPKMVTFTRRELKRLGCDAYAKHFFQGLATDLSSYFSEDAFDWVIWKRLGNHLIDDQEWVVALGEVVKVLMHGGTFLLCESLLDGNESRVMSPGSKFRPLAAYNTALAFLVRLEDREVSFYFSGDSYRIELYQKP